MSESTKVALVKSPKVGGGRKLRVKPLHRPLLTYGQEVFIVLLDPRQLKIMPGLNLRDDGDLVRRCHQL